MSDPEIFSRPEERKDLLEEVPSSSPKELLLLEREVKVKERFKGSGPGEATFVKLKDDGGGVFKAHRDFLDRKAIEFSRNERAAYLIDTILGFELVPPTVLRMIEGKIGSLQEFIPDPKTGYELRLKVELEQGRIEEEEVIKLALFDLIIVNTDRYPANYIIKDGKLYAIDNGLALKTEDLLSKTDFKIIGPRLPITDKWGLTNYEWFNIYQKVTPQKIREKLKKIASSESLQTILRKLLGEVLEEKVISALIKRIIAIDGSIDENGVISEAKLRELLGI